MTQLEGHVALVTAAGGGIGQATAWLLAERGAAVIAVDIDETGLAETAAKAAGRLSILKGDATKWDDAQAAVAAAKREFGKLTILANVVGGSRPGQTILDMSPEDWSHWVDLNLTSTFLMCKAAIPLMAESGGGSIVNVSSGAGVTGMMRNPAYVAAKGGVIALTRSLAIDHADQHIRANCVAPGPILTPLMERNRRPEEIDYLAKMTLAGRIGMPHDIAATIAFLSSKDGEFINGELINVAGGRRGGV
ncbi:SDR family NAD(P)-dependent oxidoreductase [Sphingoaurantiacus capsulatus]|uniref:SDR family NAD(P)-dependent oxidoreductase n=1 Tax=Sphingoaurantiacus capsulatus TaxID=1771310 RepID=A0ABV7X9L5_9SPHN